MKYNAKADFYAGHSANSFGKTQKYDDHIKNVMYLSTHFAKEAGKYNRLDGDLLVEKTMRSAYFHDLGKLYKKNQNILIGLEQARHLPIDHVDPGVLACKRLGSNYYHEAIAIYAHHRGLPDLVEESLRGTSSLRNNTIKDSVDKTIEPLIKKHEEFLGAFKEHSKKTLKGNNQIFLRMLLSCLADGDHTDTAIHYGNYPTEIETIPLKPEQRLRQLNKYISGFSLKTERNKLRNAMYINCAMQDEQISLTACDSPVGTGKTTALMAYLLNQGNIKGLRRIFVVLPYTNIISQSVKVYRETLVLPGENPEEVVAELHHLADFGNRDLRHLTALWKAPIIVTTSVAFFETLAANKPSSLRRLHQLPGSAIFLDEAHASLPKHLLPIAWEWMKALSKEWGCHWLFASGTLARFWEIPAITKDEDIKVQNVLKKEVSKKLKAVEKQRVKILWEEKPLHYSEFLKTIIKDRGPRIVVVNTIQTAAFLAHIAKKEFGRKKVEHLSNALLYEDIKKTIQRIEMRLGDKNDNDWTLFATTCVEAGMDFSFYNGYREMCSLLNLLQFIGRINRENLYRNSKVGCFTLKDHYYLTKNPSMDTGSKVLEYYLKSNISINSDLSTEALSLELKKEGYGKYDPKRFLELEKAGQFQTFAKEFKVIDQDSCLVLIKDVDLNQCDWKSIQKITVQMSKKKVKDLGLKEFIEGTGLYKWDRKYDNFLGYMAGILE